MPPGQGRRWVGPALALGWRGESAGHKGHDPRAASPGRRVWGALLAVEIQGRSCKVSTHAEPRPTTWAASAPLRRRRAPPRADHAPARPRPALSPPPRRAPPHVTGLVTGGGGAGGSPPPPRGAAPPPPPPPPPPRRATPPPPPPPRGATPPPPPPRRPREAEPEPEPEPGGIERAPGRARGAPPAMDHKPLLQERPPAYTLEAGQGDFACGPHGYGAIPTAPPPPPYPYLVTGGRGARAGAGRRERTWGRVPGRPLTPKSSFLRPRRGPRRGAGAGPGEGGGTRRRVPESRRRPGALRLPGGRASRARRSQAASQPVFKLTW